MQEESTMNNLLDEVVTKEKARIGIIDYSNKKQIFFYDLTHNNDPDIRVLLTMWRMNDDPNLDRFSLFAAITFPSLVLPEKRIIPKNAIENLEDIEEPEYEVGVSKTKVSSK